MIEEQSFFAGDDVGVFINIKRKIPFPLFYCLVEEMIPNSLNRLDHRFQEQSFAPVERQFKKIIFPWFKREINIQFDFKHVPRGEHHLEYIKVKTGDFFGFITKEYLFEVADQLKVYPRRRKVNMTEQMSGFEQGAVSIPALNYRSAHIASGIREYAPGDKLSWINWKQTARKNKMMTKEFEQEKSTDTLVVLDSSVREEKNERAFEVAVEVTSGLIETLLNQETNMGFLSIGEDLFQVPLYYNPSKVNRIREHLMKIEPIKMKGFSNQLKKELLRIGNEYVVIIITTHMDASLKQTVMWIKQRTKRVFVILVKCSDQVGKREHDLIQGLKFEKIIVSVISEKELNEKMIEVSV